MSQVPEWAETSPLWFSVFALHQGWFNGGEPQWVDDKLLAAAIRREPHIPHPALVELVAGRLDGSVSRPRGRPAESNAWDDVDLIDRGTRDEIRVGIRQAAFRLQGLRTPKERAINAEAKAQHISPHTLKNRMREYRRAARGRARFVALNSEGDAIATDWSGFVEQAIGAEIGRLDPAEGFAWADDAAGHLENPE